MHSDRKQHRHDHDEQVFVFRNLRKPARLSALVYDADVSRSLGDLPAYDEVGYDLSGHIVHLEGKQGLVCVELGLKDGRNCGPDCTGRKRRNEHHRNEHRTWHLVGEVDHASSGCQRSCKHLPLATEVPELHPKGGREGKRHAEQKRGFLQQNPRFAWASKGTFDHRAIHVDGVESRRNGRDDATHHDGKPNNT